LNAAASAIASLQSAEALKILSGKPDALHGQIISCDVWTGKFRSVRAERNPDCRACVRRDFRYLNGRAQPHITLCGRDSVQIHERHRKLDLADLGRRLASAAGDEVRNNDFLLRFRVPPYEMTIFADGRAIVKERRIRCGAIAVCALRRRVKGAGILEKLSGEAAKRRLRIAALSMFSRQFIRVKSVLRIRALSSSDMANPLVPLGPARPHGLESS